MPEFVPVSKKRQRYTFGRAYDLVEMPDMIEEKKTPQEPQEQPKVPAQEPIQEPKEEPQKKEEQQQETKAEGQEGEAG